MPTPGIVRALRGDLGRRRIPLTAAEATLIERYGIRRLALG
jgi:hypothetical protein